MTTLIGMNNPYSARSDTALLPAPVRSAGWNLWKMLNDVGGHSRYRYVRGFSRVNLCDGEWNPKQAREKYLALWPTLRGQRAILLGKSVLNVTWMDHIPMMSWGTHEDVSWCWIPHPSGMNRLYNDPVLRQIVGMRLEETIE